MDGDFSLEGKKNPKEEYVMIYDEMYHKTKNPDFSCCGPDSSSLLNVLL